MADSDDLLSGVFGLIAVVVVAVIVLYLIFLAVQLMAVGGAVYGAGISLRNYGLAFAHNVKPQRGVA